MVKNFLPLLAAAASAQDSVLDVSLEIDQAEVARGSSVSYTCSWHLDADYDPCQEKAYLAEHGGNVEECQKQYETILRQFELTSEASPDYETDDFQLVWKAAGQAVARYDDNGIIFYHGASVSDDRANVTAQFDGTVNTEHYVKLDLFDVQLEDDNMNMVCEVHWNRRYKGDQQTLNVYVDAESVELFEHESLLEGRAHTDMNGTLFEVEQAEVATCSISGVYPRPEQVVFRVGDSDEVVSDVEPVLNEETGLYDVEATLSVLPSSEYDQDQVYCVSQAAASADFVESDANSTFTLDVSYYTNSVSLTISGANEDASGNYYINENQPYTVHCEANGNPAPEINVYGPDGLPITSGAEAIASRSDSLQHITCTAENNDEDFNLGEEQTAKKQLSVYYLDEPVTTVNEEYEYGESVVMECSAEGNPAPKFTWLKDGSVVKSGATLSIDSMKYEDAGSYTCRAENDAGESEATTSVKVDGPCIATITGKTPAQSQTQPAAASLTLTCRVVGPDCTITWSSSTDPELVAQGETLTNENGVASESELFFEAIDKRINPVQFECSGENNRGIVSDRVMVDDNDEPVCCNTTNTGNLGTGAIVGIVIAIPAVLIIIGAVVFFCRNKQGADDTKSDLEEAGEEDEPSEKAPLTDGNGGEGGNAGDDEQV